MTAGPPAAGEARRIAIIGGGMAGLAAAWRLSDQLGPMSEITVYEQGFQLGGKGASGRGVHDRIEEHGLHVWLGYYDNAFRLIREVYDDLDRDRTAPGCPIRSWRDAFSPAGRVGVEERTGRGWQHWVATFSTTAGEPGDDDTPGGTASVAQFLRRGVRLLADFSVSLLEMRADERSGDSAASRVEPTIVLSGSPRPPRPARSGPGRSPGRSAGAGDLGGLLQQAQFAVVIAAVEGIRLLGSAVPSGSLDVVAEQLERMRVDLEVVVTRGDPSLRRLGDLVDLVLTCCLGIVADRLLVDPRGFGAIDDEDFRGWLRRHGARESTLESALVRGMYDLVFAYADGDRDRPQFCAGLGLFLAGKFFFDYRGSLFWRMQAGMGDVVFAPLYQALQARGVRFAFFHRLDRLRLDGERGGVDSLVITRTRRCVGDGGRYQPLIMVDGLPCFRSEPDDDQLDETAEVIELRVGTDVDTVVLAASIGSLAGPCAELIEDSPRWRSMIDNVATVGTQSLQLWLRSSEAELGWDFPASTVSGYVPPFDTYASMTHLLSRERWPGEDRPQTLGYFCGSLETVAPDSDPLAVVTAHATRFLEEHAGHFWPGAAGPDGFAWDQLVEGTGARGGGPERLADQYVRANVEGSQRYVQSLPGSQRHRLRVDESGYDHLVLAGDWTNCGLNAGCIEAATMSGLEAANTVLGDRLMSGITGSWYGVGS
jgi:uncharacterized protein with NAD-binding domain and iron-sulfur cluster